jgi:hypothetical protein
VDVPAASLRPIDQDNEVNVHEDDSMVGTVLKLREWLSIGEAATQLTAAFDEPVTAADVLRFGLDASFPLTLSVNFLNHAYAKVGKRVPMAQAERVPGIPVPGREPYDVILGLQLENDEVVQFEGPVRSVEGVWDLPMVGGERIAVENYYQRAIGGPPVELINMDGSFATDPSGECWISLQDEFGEEHGERKGDDRFYPASGLPEGAMLVVRTEELERFIRSAKDPDAAHASTEPTTRPKRAKALRPGDEKEEWIALARRFARQIFDEWPTATRPSISELARRVEAKLKIEGIVGARGNFLSSESIRARALRGREWNGSE